MHRAEKSSSKICRNREVERAQELHRKKIDGVKSYITAITKPTSERSPAVFRRKLPTSSAVVTSSSMVLHNDPISDSCQSIGSPPSSLGTDMDNLSDSYCDEFETSSVTIDKLDEFRVVTSTVDPKRYVHAKVPPRASTHSKTLNGSFRTRRLKQIQVDNVGLFQRIRNSAAHYRNDDLRRDWDQNVSYLASICEFPLTKECIVSQNNLQCPPQSGNDGMDDFVGWRPTIKTPVHLPEMVHPIKSIPTSPKRLQLNLSPAFRSLRKAMPQQPSLPPITSPNRLATSVGNLHGILSPNTSCSQIPLHNISDAHVITASTSKPVGNIGSRSSRHVLSSPFEGDGATTSPAAHDDPSIAQSGLEITKYQLLRTGRFVGGTYLILTVFCGHGITNPYGFDVHALHPESHYEYRLNITKEMTHQLLDTISSSSLAAVTAAAAGTNLSMEQIAQNICDHVNFSSLESNLGELIFLVSTLGGSKDRVLLLDCDTSCMSFCLHHLVELENGIANPVDFNDSSLRKRRKMHVNVTTRPPKCCTASMTLIPPASGNSSGTVICFQLLDDHSTSSSQFDAHVEVELDELYRVVGQASERSRSSRFGERPEDRSRATVSLERIVSAAIRHLHIVAVPTGADTPDDHKEVLIFNQYVNEKLHLTGRPSIPRVFSQPMLSKSHLTQSSGSLSFERQSDASLLLESGLVWKNMYFLTRIHVDSETEASRWRTTSSIHDLDGPLALHVFNSQSGQHSSKTLASDLVQAFARKLSSESTANHWTLLGFAKRILERMHVDVDLFGHEILTFPGLEPPKAARGDTGAASPRSRYHRDRSNGGIDASCEPVIPAGANHAHADDRQVAADMRVLNQDSFSEAAGDEDSDGAFEPEEDNGDEQEAVDGVGRHQAPGDNSSALVSRRRRQGQKRSAGFGLRMQDAWLTIGPLGQLHAMK